jgi:3'-phosphoadenosine 5'-phosphosulfate sulfotransferase (PAPS reductase)/FAD synthetase
MRNKDIVSWWSGGIASAVCCKLTIDIFGIDKVRIVFIDTKNEHNDTYRFRDDCELWYGIEIETISSTKHNDIFEV